MTEVGYSIKGNQDTGPAPQFHSDVLSIKIANHIDAHAGPWKLQGKGAANLARTHRFAKKHFPEVILNDGGKPGDVYNMYNERANVRVEILLTDALTVGQKMLADEHSHFGAAYLLGGNAPGPSDCSGWVLYEYEKYGHFKFNGHFTVTMFKQLGGVVGEFPNLMPGRSEQGIIFRDEGRCKQSDLVFKSYPGFATPADNPDHVGLWVRPNIMRDTRSVNERLADRTIDDALGQTLFGRVFSVNGAL